MSEFINGRYYGDDDKDIAATMFEYENELRGGNLNTDTTSTVLGFYRGAATVVEGMQEDMSTLLDQQRIDFATEEALELKTNSVGVTREPAKKATGMQQFYVYDALTIDVEIPEGTVVYTVGDPQVKFETEEYAKLEAGMNEVMVPVSAKKPGAQSNVGANSLNEIERAEHPDLRTTNPNAMTGGRARETDEELRERAKKGGNEFSQATENGLISAIKRLEKTIDTHLFVNDSPNDNEYGNGLPAWHMEIVVDYDGQPQDIIDVIGQYRGAGDPLVAGINGTEITGTYELDNGQIRTYRYSEPSEVAIYVDATFSKDPDVYEGDNAVKDAMVEYVGGIMSNGSFNNNGLQMSNDVLVGELEAKVRSVDGVYDVTNITAGRADPPTEDGVLEIDTTESAILDGRTASGFIDLTTSNI